MIVKVGIQTSGSAVFWKGLAPFWKRHSALLSLTIKLVTRKAPWGNCVLMTRSIKNDFLDDSHCRRCVLGGTADPVFSLTTAQDEESRRLLRDSSALRRYGD
jgi:hypothetical protein